MRISYVNHGIGNNFGEEIEINENLKKYPSLHDKVLQHELGHTDKLFTKKDFTMDLLESNVNSFQMLKFMLRHPRSFSQLLPIYWTKKHGFVYDINLCIMYIAIFFIIFVAFFCSKMV